jgi:hypothetical protein
LKFIETALRPVTAALLVGAMLLTIGCESKQAEHPEGETASGQSASGEGSENAEDSILTYGDEASARLETNVTKDVREFLQAISAEDYVAVCAGIAKTTQSEIGALSSQGEERCPEVVDLLLEPSAATTAARVATSTIETVRVRGRSAVVIFAAGGGQGRSFLPMRRERGGWRAATIAPGLPVTP